MGFTPGRSTAGSGLSNAKPSRSLLDMRDKTVWGHGDDSKSALSLVCKKQKELTGLVVGLWDAREYFSGGKVDSLVYRHENLTSLPRCTEELRFGDIALVYYCASTYPSKNNTTGMSHNLYGAALLARRQDSDY